MTHYLICAKIGRVRGGMDMQPKFEVKHTVGGAYNLNYHLVWTTAFNRKVLDDEIAEYIKEVALEAAGKIGVQVHLFEIVDDHYVNCLLSAPPKISVTDILKILKGKTAMYAVKKYPELKSLCYKQKLWNRSFYAETVGSITKRTVKRYLQNQERGSNPEVHLQTGEEMPSWIDR